MLTKKIYRLRFTKKENLERKMLWEVLSKEFFQKYINKNATAMDIGAGYCEFLNSIKCKKKIAVDINPDTKLHAKKDITVLNYKAIKIPKKYHGKIDAVFMSNFLEHLNDKEETRLLFEKIHLLLKPSGRLLIMQPNIDLVKERYWDYFDHKNPLNVSSIEEGLRYTNFHTVQVIKRFMPYTVKSMLPKRKLFIKLYLKIPPFLRPFAGQSFIYAKKVKK